MKDQLIKLRSVIREICDRLDGEKLASDKKRHQRNLIVQYLEQASIEAGALLRELNEDSK
jgi:hypothetical protein